MVLHVFRLVNNNLAAAQSFVILRILLESFFNARNFFFFLFFFFAFSLSSGLAVLTECAAFRFRTSDETGFRRLGRGVRPGGDGLGVELCAVADRTGLVHVEACWGGGSFVEGRFDGRRRRGMDAAFAGRGA